MQKILVFITLHLNPTMLVRMVLLYVEKSAQPVDMVKTTHSFQTMLKLQVQLLLG